MGHLRMFRVASPAAKRLAFIQFCKFSQICTALLCSQVEAQTAGCGSVSGDLTSGVFCAPGVGVDATLATTAGTTFNTTGAPSLRATARNANALISLFSTSIVNSPTAAASGVQAQVTSGTGNTSVVVSGSSSILMQAAGQDGIALSNASSGTSGIRITPGALLAISNTVVGNEHDGLDIASNGGGNISLRHEGSGSISTVGGNAIWLKASAVGGNIDATIGSGVRLLVTNTDAASAGANHAGVHTRALGSGSSNVENSASIEALGQNAQGIYTEAATGDSRVYNLGSIKTDGLNGFGIRATANGGSVTIQNAGAITTTGPNGHGIYLSSGAAASGNLMVTNDAPLTVGNTGNIDGSRAIFMQARGSGNAVVNGRGDINVLGQANTLRSHGIIITAESGNILVDYAGSISAQGLSAGGIRAESASGNVEIDYSGARIETFHTNANAIYASTGSATGKIRINAQGTLVTHSDAGSGDGSGILSFGLQGTSLGGDVDISFSGPSIDVNGRGAAILAANAYGTGTGAGTLSVLNSGALTARGNLQQGIHSFSTTGAQTIDNQGNIQTLGALDSQGILAEAGAAASIKVLNSARITTVGDNASGIEARSPGGNTSVTNGAGGDVVGGWGSSAGVLLGGDSQTLSNAGAIQALSDMAVRADANGAGTDLIVSNTGQITGQISAPSARLTLQNSGNWSLRNFADTDGDGIRDRLAIAIASGGPSTANTIQNQGPRATIALLGAGGAAVRSLDITGQHLPLGNPNNAMTLNGPVQGHILSVSSFSNAGQIDLTANPRVGDVLVISGGRTAGVDGGGVFVANGGSLKLNSVLNAGGNAGRSQSDMLVLDSTRLGSGPTGISISNIGGQGATPTLGNGIALVEVLNKQASAPGVFTLSTAAVAGIHEYLLYQGGNERTGGNPADGNWYLRSEIVVQPTPPSPPDPTPPVPSVHPLFRPEVGAYLSNRRQASGMFLHSLHDRLGEPQYDQEPAADEPEKKRKSGWLRIVGKSTHARTSDSVFQVKSDSTLIQGGGDFVRWATGEDDESRAYFGGMLAYGQARSDATAEYNQRKAHSEVDGWSLGLYGTWFQNDATKLGTYVDVWGQLGLFNSSMEGERLPEVNYNGRSINLSGEVGYAMRVLSSEWIVEPQAQLVYVKYNEDEITEPNGTRIAGNNGSAWVSRLGIRTYGTWIHNGRKFQPFLTLNWWHDTADNALAFNSVTVEDVYPNNRYEVKLGLHADFSKGWTGWGNVGYLWGKQDFKTTSLRLGVKYMW